MRSLGNSFFFFFFVSFWLKSLEFLIFLLFDRPSLTCFVYVFVSVMYQFRF